VCILYEKFAKKYLKNLSQHCKYGTRNANSVSKKKSYSIDTLGCSAFYRHILGEVIVQFVLEH
jgi:hypothetical protein